MLRQPIIKSSIRVTTTASSTRRLFSSTPMAFGEGDLGSHKQSGGGDAFSKRAKANEDYYVRDNEKQKLKNLKDKLDETKEEVSKMQKDIERAEGAPGKT